MKFKRIGGEARRTPTFPPLMATTQSIWSMKTSTSSGFPKMQFRVFRYSH
uniref:Uncharacterized protein n=1 Tax=Nelumbo nucifera TaxID=4432 RepID=A0A822YLJ2_NELNU|nr:TPA_asm: hypothetical protein HUJ06_011302 [Nelumbo nucifera]